MYKTVLLLVLVTISALAKLSLPGITDLKPQDTLVDRILVNS